MLVVMHFPSFPTWETVRHLPHECYSYLGNQKLSNIILDAPCLWLKHFPTWEGGSAFRNAAFLVGKMA